MFELRSTACYADAQRLLELVTLMPQGNVPTTWALMHPLLAALCTVLSAIANGYYEHGTQKAAVLQLCRDVLLALDLAAQAVVEPFHASAVDMCHHLLLHAEQH